MARDRAIGGAILAGSIIVIIVYGWLLFALGPGVSLIVLQITAMIAVAVLLGILAWIGYTMATTPPPAPIEAEIPSPATSTTTPQPAAETKP